MAKNNSQWDISEASQWIVNLQSKSLWRTVRTDCCIPKNYYNYLQKKMKLTEINSFYHLQAVEGAWVNQIETLRGHYKTSLYIWWDTEKYWIISDLSIINQESWNLKLGDCGCSTPKGIVKSQQKNFSPWYQLPLIQLQLHFSFIYPLLSHHHYLLFVQSHPHPEECCQPSNP